MPSRHPRRTEPRQRGQAPEEEEKEQEALKEDRRRLFSGGRNLQLAALMEGHGASDQEEGLACLPSAEVSVFPPSPVAVVVLDTATYFEAM